MHVFPLILRRAACLGVALVLALSVITPRAGAAGPLPQDQRPVTLRIAMPELHSLDPVLLSRFDRPTRDLVENLFIGLTRYDPIQRTIEPALATSWTVSPDGLQWTFELREDIYWVRTAPGETEPSVVRPVVAGDLVYAVQRACDPLRPSPVTANLMAIKGCHTVATAFPQLVTDLFIAREIGVRATGPHTLQIDLLYPVSHFPTLLSTPELRPLPREAFTDTPSLTRQTPLVVSGPFIVQSWTPQGMILVRNPYWPDAFSGNIEQIAITFTAESQQTLSLFGADQVDFARLDSAQAEEARARFPTALQSAEGNSLVMLGFAYERPLIEQAAFRRALSLALDRAALVNQVFPGQALPAASAAPADAIAAPASPSVVTDPQAARLALEEAGHAGCSSIKEPLTVLVPDDDPLWMEAGRVIVEQWAQTLGCNPALFTVKAVARPLLIELGHANYDPEKVTRSPIWVFSWSADYPDVSGWLYDALHCRYGYIRNGRPCDEADALMDQALLTYDQAQRQQDYTQVETLFFGTQGSYPIAPLFWTATHWLQGPRLSSINTAGAARFDLWQLTPPPSS